MKPADVQVQGTYDGNMIMKGSHHSTKGSNLILLLLLKTFQNYFSDLLIPL